MSSGLFVCMVLWEPFIGCFMEAGFCAEYA